MKPDYGIDAPGVIRNLLLIGMALLILGYFLPQIALGSVVINFRPMAWTTGVFCVAEGLLMIAYAKFGKFRHRDRMMNLVNWKGNERVLDVGTGRGLLMIGAAKHLTTGKSVGIDIWSGKDLSGNSLEGTLRNVALEGVKDKVEVREEDATALQFPDNSFDVVVSNLCLHNIPSRTGRDKACREIVRVLKPGGTAVISDYKNTAEYLRLFRSLGTTASRGGMQLLDTFPPLRIVTAVKSSAGQ
ncbi:MAG: class I SAM-dependent methyltransferase [Acidobacteriales bacterium]|nr:class I SAM-dependent methyltransferase [Terriglobales bacterium]